MSAGSAAPIARKPRRQRRSSPVAATAAGPGTAIGAFPGIAFSVVFEGGRKASFDLGDLKRKTLATQAARIVWRAVSIASPRGSSASLRSPASALRRFDEFLKDHDPADRVATFADVTAADVDAFEDWMRRRPVSGRTAHDQFGDFVALLRSAAAERLTATALEPRLAYLSVLEKPDDDKPLDAFPTSVALGLREAARADVVAAIARLDAGRARVERAAAPRREVDPPDEVDVYALAVRLGEIPPAHHADQQPFGPLPGTTRHSVTMELFPGISDMFAFVLLIAEETGLPIECVRGLSADCLRDDAGGEGTLRYLKRRAGRKTRTLTVSTDERFSTGWLVRTWLTLSAGARALAPAEERGSLFVGLGAGRFMRLRQHRETVPRFLERHEIKDGAKKVLDTLDLRRLRKSKKASNYRRVGGDIRLFADDNLPQTAVKHYARIAANAELHEAMIEKGLRAAFDGALATAVVVAPSGAVGGPPPAGDDLAVAQCLDFTNSPYSERGRPCGAPLLGCLDCANAVVTDAKLPALFHLLRDLEDKRREMNLGAWTSAFGASFVRVLTILERFPATTLESAHADAQASFGRSWSPIQLVLKV